MEINANPKKFNFWQKIGVSFAIKKVISWLEKRGWSQTTEDKKGVVAFLQAVALNLLELEFIDSDVEVKQPKKKKKKWLKKTKRRRLMIRGRRR